MNPKKLLLLISLGLWLAGCGDSESQNQGQENFDSGQLYEQVPVGAELKEGPEDPDTLIADKAGVAADSTDTLIKEKPKHPEVQRYPKADGVPTPADKKPGDPSTRKDQQDK